MNRTLGQATGPRTAPRGGSPPRRVVVRVGPGPLRPDRLPPAGQLVAESVRLLRALGGQVVPLAEVLLQVIQLGPSVLVPLDELEITPAGGAARLSPLVAVVRVVPVQ